jgi:hypothetical protein
MSLEGSSFSSDALGSGMAMGGGTCRLLLLGRPSLLSVRPAEREKLLEPLNWHFRLLSVSNLSLVFSITWK